MEMALGGFSGQATRLLARHLARHGEEFWPPVYEDEGLQIGAYVVNFVLSGQAASDREFAVADQPAETTVIKLDGEVIARRMQQHVAAE
jgi:hypothetical protein